MSLLPFQDSFQLLAFFLAAILVGFSKAGIKGVGMFGVVLLATAFGGKSSTGIFLPMLIVGDVMAVIYYQRDVIWKYIWRLIPAAALGVIAATLIGDYIDDVTFRKSIAYLILGSLLLLIYLERYPLDPKKVDHPLFGRSMGFLGGICTMIGNAAGPVMSVFLLSTRLPKNQFIGTAAYFFMMINLFKLPFHIFVWETISMGSIGLILWAIPVIVVGFLIGFRLVKLIPEKAFRYFVIGVTTVVALRLLFI